MAYQVFLLLVYSKEYLCYNNRRDWKQIEEVQTADFDITFQQVKKCGIL